MKKTKETTESNIFGGHAWSPQEQFEHMLEYIAIDIQYTLFDYKKFSSSKKANLIKEIDTFMKKLKKYGS